MMPLMIDDEAEENGRKYHHGQHEKSAFTEKDPIRFAKMARITGSRCD